MVINVGAGTRISNFRSWFFRFLTVFLGASSVKVIIVFGKGNNYYLPQKVFVLHKVINVKHLKQC